MYYAQRTFENGQWEWEQFTDYTAMVQWLAMHPEAGITAWVGPESIDQCQLQADVAAYV